MRVLTVSHFYEAHGGGIERVAGHLCRQFTRLGVEAVWAASDADPAPEAEVQVVPLGCVNPIEKFTGLPMPLPGVRAIRILASEVRRCDAVVVHDALYATSILAWLIAKAHRKRVVLVQHIASIPFHSAVLRTLMTCANLVVTRPMLRAVDSLVFISDTVRHELLGTPSRVPCQLLFNGVDPALFHPADGEPPVPNALSAVTFPPGSRRVLFVGRYVDKKGLAIVRALAASRPDLKLLMAGTGPIRPADWGLPNIHELGMQDPRALADLYRWVDLLLLPSVGEGFPLVVQEAMACGLPVVCGQPTNHADPDAAHWLCGVDVNLADPEGSARRCAEAIDRLALKPSERAAMARYAAARYDWSAMAQSVLTMSRGNEAKA